MMRRGREEVVDRLRRWATGRWKAGLVGKELWWGV